MKKILLFALLLLLSSCGLAPASVPTATETASLNAATPTPIPFTSSPEPTVTPEATGIKFERVEANREAINNYVFIDTVVELNKDGAYFKEFGITSKEQLIKMIKENGDYFPASAVKNTHLIFFGSTYEGAFEKIRISMDKKLKADLDLEIVNPDQIINTKIYSGQVHPWFNFMGNEGTPREKSVSVGVGVKVLDDQRQLVLQLVWKDKNYDLFGNKLKTPGVVTSEMTNQADFLFRTTLYIGHIVSDPLDYVDKEAGRSFAVGHGRVGKYNVFSKIKEMSESGQIIPNFPPQTIQ